MEDAALYKGHNSLQRQGTEGAIRRHWPQMRWLGGERALDVGCGPGDVTCDLLLPALPPASTIIGIDVSAEMVEYASSKYSMQNVHFQTVDFSMKNITSVFQAQSFTKIFSFYCLHWIRDQEQVADNVSALLRPGGQFLFVVAPSNQVFRAYRALALMDQWKPYMHDLDSFVPCFNESADAGGDMRRILEAAGLQVETCDDRTETITYPSMHSLMDALEAVSPFVGRMSEAVRGQHRAALERVCLQLGLCRPGPRPPSVTTANPHVVLTGTKPT